MGGRNTVKYRVRFHTAEKNEYAWFGGRRTQSTVGVSCREEKEFAGHWRLRRHHWTADVLDGVSWRALCGRVCLSLCVVHVFRHSGTHHCRPIARYATPKLTKNQVFPTDVVLWVSVSRRYRHYLQKMVCYQVQLLCTEKLMSTNKIPMYFRWCGRELFINK